MNNDQLMYHFYANQLDAVSVTEIEEHIDSHQQSIVYKIMLAAKMKQSISNLGLLQISDPLMLQPQNFLRTKNNKVERIGHFESNDSPTLLADEINQNVLESTFTKERENINTADIIQAESAEVKDGSISDILETDEFEKLDIPKIEKEDLNTYLSKTKKSKKLRKDKKFKLREYSGISEYALWLLSFKENNIEAKIKKETKAFKKKQIADSAAKSIQMSDKIVSEALADILAMQGHLDEAKKMYEQLMRINPEKSAYFAAKIDNLLKQ